MNRGEFVCVAADMFVDLTDMERMNFNSVKCIYAEYGRRFTFPRNSIPYSQDTIADLARYGYISIYDGSKLGRVRCVYCHMEILDYDACSPAAIDHCMKDSWCDLPNGHGDNTLHHDKPIPQQKSSLIAFKLLQDDSNKRDVIFSWYAWGHIKKRTIRAPGFFKAYKDGLNSVNENDKIIPMPAADLAKYGFVCRGPGGSVGYYACGLCVTNWQPEDLAAFMHLEYSPDCPS